MKIDRLTHWCMVATSRIRYGPDRERVYGELRLHTQDRMDSFVAKGFSEEEAKNLTLEAMGDPQELALQLGQIHSPFWGFFLRACRIATVILLLLCTLVSILAYGKLDFYDPPQQVFDPTYYAGKGTLLLISQPDESFSVRDSRFTVTDIVMYHREIDDSTCLHFRMEQRTQLPWHQQEPYFMFKPNVSLQLEIRDSLGNTYIDDFHFIQTGIFTATMDYLIQDFPQEAQWIEIAYRRDGNQAWVRIDLTGGVSA